jgi:hypothetical protein
MGPVPAQGASGALRKVDAHRTPSASEPPQDSHTQTSTDRDEVVINGID